MGSDWTDQAACRDRDPELFFPESRDPRSHKSQVAKRICLRCPVRRECLQEAFYEAVFLDEYGRRHTVSSRDYGIFGGTLPAERRAFIDFPDRIDHLMRLVELQGQAWGLVGEEEQWIAVLQ